MGAARVRPAAVAGSWYSDSPHALARDVDQYLAAVARSPRGDVRAIVSPHAGLVYSGSVAAHAYRAVAAGDYDVIVLVGPSHFVGFEGAALPDAEVFDCPLGPVALATETIAAIGRSPMVHVSRAAHAREHSLEMQLPFLRRVLPGVPIVPLLVAAQDRATLLDLARLLAATLARRKALLIASSDLSHYFDRERAAQLDARVVDHCARFDAEGLFDELERYPEHERGRYVACGGGAVAAVMTAAAALGATDAVVLSQADSSVVSGDVSAVVGYVAAAFGTQVSGRAGAGPIRRPETGSKAE